MWYTWRFYARFSTSSAKSCFLDFRYARISVSVCCRSQLILSGMGWDAMCISGMHMDCTTFGFHSDLSSKGGVKIYISGRWEISCTCMTSYLVVLMVDNIVNERITLRSWDFAEYHLRMICFRCGKLVNGSIILHSWDLSDYHLWATDLSRFSMLNEHYDGQRAQPTLGLHSLCFVVESCDVFVGNRTLFEPFGNIATVSRREWKLLGISSRLESSLPFAQKPLLGFCDLWTVFELNTQRYSLAQARARETECVLKRCLLSGVIWAREHGKLDSGLFESFWVTLIAIGFALVFKVQLSGAKFYAFHLFHLFVLGWCFPVPGLVRTALTFILFLTLVLVITLDFFGLGLPGFPGCSWVSVCRCDFNLHLWLFCLNLLLSITALLSLDWSGLLWTFLANGVNQRALSEPQLFRILHLVIWCFLVPGLDKIALSKSTLNILRLCFNRALDPAKASTEAPASISCWRYFLVPGLVKSVLPAGTHLLWLNSTKAFFFGWVLFFVLSVVPGGRVLAGWGAPRSRPEPWNWWWPSRA